MRPVARVYRHSGFVRERGLYVFPQNKGCFYHDGRFKTLMDVVNNYDDRFFNQILRSDARCFAALRLRLSRPCKGNDLQTASSHIFHHLK